MKFEIFLGSEQSRVRNQKHCRKKAGNSLPAPEEV